MADLIDREAVLSILAGIARTQGEYDASYDKLMQIPPVNRWIPCSEMLPNEAGEYLVCGRWGGEKPKTWICQFRIFVDIGGFVNSAKNPPVSFWMPIPDAYKPPEKE